MRRFEDDLADEHGLLIKHNGGRWVFSYEPGDDDDEPIFQLSTHRFLDGEYINITEHDGKQRTFRIVSASDYAPS